MTLREAANRLKAVAYQPSHATTDFGMAFANLNNAIVEGEANVAMAEKAIAHYRACLDERCAERDAEKARADAAEHMADRATQRAITAEDSRDEAVQKWGDAEQRERALVEALRQVQGRGLTDEVIAHIESVLVRYDTEGK